MYAGEWVRLGLLSSSRRRLPPSGNTLYLHDQCGETMIVLAVIGRPRSLSRADSNLPCARHWNGRLDSVLCSQFAVELVDSGGWGALRKNSDKWSPRQMVTY